MIINMYNIIINCETQSRIQLKGERGRMKWNEKI